MSTSSADVVICGAGIAGIAAAYHLTRHGVGDVLLVDDRPPLSLTSDKSTECYRNWWPGPGDGMVRLMNRSIDLLEELARETGNAFRLNRRGYLFATANPARVADFRAQADEAAALGAGPVRLHAGRADDPVYDPAPESGFEGQPDGADLITDPALIRRHFPYLAEDTVAVVHPRRCGWFSAALLGQVMLERARLAGTRLVEARLEGVEVAGGKVEAVRLGAGAGTARVRCGHFVNAAGPYLKPVGAMLGVELPLFSEFHAKIAFNDHLGAFPRQAPLLIWSDPQRLDWNDEERTLLGESPATRALLDEFPEGVHARPEGPADSPIVLILWTYHADPVEPAFPVPVDPQYPEIALRGLARMLPGLKVYFGRSPRTIVDGGYYTKTGENRPLVGPLPVRGAWILGALSGFGLMASSACGELLAQHLTGGELPPYAHWFQLERYQDPEYQALLRHWGRTGQL
jgi:sarcosine oxidase, subunit beta